MSRKKWIRVSAAAKLMGMTPRGALKRLQRINKHIADGRLMRRDSPTSPWEVSVQVLEELDSVHLRDHTLEKLNSKVERLEVQVLALRNSHQSHRRKTARRLEELNQMELGFPPRRQEHAGTDANLKAQTGRGSC